MSEPYLGEIRMFSGPYAPRDWAFCNGQILQISQYTALYSVIGTDYGGDGHNTFGLPDMRGRIALSIGQRPELSAYSLGQTTGVERVTLSAENLPAHTHTVIADAQGAGDFITEPDKGYIGATGGGQARAMYVSEAPGDDIVQLNEHAIAPEGVEPASVYNLQPVLAINFIIALKGVYPQAQ
ncbi:MAG: phage tail protein [Alphaproteobacteria bacterium]|nr:MAG: phage tail protein [Alphaproteobacteria bacterium]